MTMPAAPMIFNHRLSIRTLRQTARLSRMFLDRLRISAGTPRLGLLSAGIACLAAPGFAFQTTIGPSPESAEQAIIRRIDAAVFARESEIVGYSVQEHYAIFRNGEAATSSEMTVQTTFRQGAGKDYKPLTQSGSSLLRSAVIEKVLAGEKEMSQADTRDSVLVDSTNYEMHLEPNPVSMAGRQCLVVNLKPRRKSPHLFNGKAWVDAQDFMVVHLEGTPSQSVSFLAGETTVSRDYIRVDGFPMAIHAEARSHSFLLGDTVLKIDYNGYQIQHAAPAIASASKP